ncbi:MAG: alpha/beta hydrolase [Oligoflexales bacterium]
MSVLLTIAISYLSLTTAAYFGQGLLQYQPTRNDPKGLGRGPWKPWRDISGDFLGYVKQSGNTVKKVVVFFHGMGGEALNWAWYSKLVPDDVVFVLAEYPGYGAKSGSPSQESIFHAADVLLDHVLKTWGAPITVAGESLGSAVACYVAARRPVARVALVSPFTSVVDVAKGWAPFLPIGPLVRDRFATVNFMDEIKQPLFLVHGDLDKVVPIKLGRELFRLYRGSQKRFLELSGFDHFTVNRAIAFSPLASEYREFLGG